MEKCTHHGEKDAWTSDWHCRYCGAQWGDTLIAYFREQAAEGGDPRYTSAVADELERRKANASGNAL